MTTGHGDGPPAAEGANAPTPWATVRVTLPAGPRSPDDLARDADRLAGIGTLIADEPDVGGAEYRDPSTLGGATQPELWVYTLPAALQRVTALAATLADRFSLEVQLRSEVRLDDDWRDSWKQFYQPLHFGDGALLVRPSWIASVPGDPQRQIVLDPGRAFGTGLHESTRLCLARLCHLHARGDAPRRVLDLGCGSGILGLAAARLWPDATVVAADNDPEATATTVENAEQNGLTHRVQVITGVLSDVPPGPFDLIIANIRPSVLIPLAPSVPAFLAPGGRALLSGVLREERAAVAAAWTEAGFFDAHRDDAGLIDADWCALELDGPS
jgi:ribosomal protein L11 methyltransferase